MFDLLNKTKLTPPGQIKTYKKIAKLILGNNYQLSLCFITPKESKKLNKIFRNKDKVANVLSFPIEKDFGEIFINLETKNEAKKFDMSYKKYIYFLFIHGLLHLKGYDHGKEMERQETIFLKKLDM